MQPLKIVNWKTSAGGLLAILTYLITNIAIPLLNGQSVDFSTVDYPGVLAAVFAISQFIIGQSARDKDKTSEDNGVSPATEASAKSAFGGR